MGVSGGLSMIGRVGVVLEVEGMRHHLGELKARCFVGVVIHVETVEGREAQQRLQ
jgi:hypothetical protein